MVQTLAIERNIKTLNQLRSEFALEVCNDENFFTEWLADFENLNQREKQELDEIKRKYLYQLANGQLGEEMIKFIVLARLLDLAGFYDPPFRLKTETTVQVEVESQEKIYRGRIDALVIQEQLWVIVIESKETNFSLELALPQTLAYMLCDRDRPTFGMITNGGNFIFIKLQQQENSSQYDTSRVFSLLPSRNELYLVLQLLKFLGETVTR